MGALYLLYLLYIFILQYLNIFVDGKLVGAFVFPHGGIAIDPYYFPANQTKRHEAIEIHRALKHASQMISDLKPDVIFLSTPHGLAHEKDFLIYQNPTAEGTAATEGNYNGFKLHIKLENNVAANMVSYLKAQNQNVSALTAFSSGDDAPIKWGEVIPLYFVPNIEKIPVVVLTQPTRRLNYDQSFIPELLVVGGHAFRFLDGLSQRVVVVISGDLAHTHDPNGPYGYSPDAAPFDKVMGQWASTLNSDYLLNPETGATFYVAKALSCGYTGHIMFQGMVNAAINIQWSPELYANYYPSYYGMFVGSFSIKSKN